VLEKIQVDGLRSKGSGKVHDDASTDRNSCTEGTTSDTSTERLSRELSVAQEMPREFIQHEMLHSLPMEVRRNHHARQVSFANAYTEEIATVHAKMLCEHLSWQSIHQCLLPALCRTCVRTKPRAITMHS